MVCLLVVDLLCHRHSRLGGRIAAVAAQSGPDGFDDLTVEVEPVGGPVSRVHLQCRHRQTLTASDAKFRALLKHAWSTVSENRTAYASGERALVLVVDESSRAHRSLAELCRLARQFQDADEFAEVVTRHGKPLAERLGHCRDASGLGPADLRATLAALDVWPVALDHPGARDAVEITNRLQELWSPADPAKALELAYVLFAHVCELTPRAGTIDLGSLRHNLKAHLPSTLGAHTRRARLHQLLKAGEARVVHSLEAIGVDEQRAADIALLALGEPPLELGGKIVVLDGDLGVGKSTELERQHRRAIQSALDDPRQPVPIFVRARDLDHAHLRELVEGESTGVGDPSAVGVHLTIDALDEAGLTVDDVASRVADASARWPNTTVVLTTRSQPASPGTRMVRVQALSADEAMQLMTRINPQATHWLPSRAELTDVLRHPLFAISYAVERQAGQTAVSHPANLVAAVGRRAVHDLYRDARHNEESSTLLGTLACAIIESGGQAVEVASLGAGALQLERLARSRVVEVADGRAMFQLAVLTEWFAAAVLLEDPDRLASCVRSPLAAYRWRYALVQALRQGSDADADLIMTELLSRAPATAAWVYAEAVEPFANRRTAPLPGTVTEIGARIRNASAQWLQPWPTLRSKGLPEGVEPVLGLAVHDHPAGSPLLTTAWRTGPGDGPPIVPLPDDIDLGGPHERPWRGLKSGSLVAGPLWAWDWARGQDQQTIDRLLEGRSLLAGVPACWQELAWDYAHRMLGRSGEGQSAPISVDELEIKVERLAQGNEHAVSVMIGGMGRHGWRLSDGQAFVEDLRRLGVGHIEPPWPVPDTGARVDWQRWSTEHLLTRLHAVSKVALDAYRELVERVVPRMASELPTYRLLPARIVGELTEGDPSKGWEGEPRLSWHIEPQETETQNEAQWTVANRSRRGLAGDHWQAVAGLYRRRRGEVAVVHGLTFHDGMPDIYGSTPAGALALSLLFSDLVAFKWTTRSSRIDSNTGSVRPVSR